MGTMACRMACSTLCLATGIPTLVTMSDTRPGRCGEVVVASTRALGRTIDSRAMDEVDGSPDPADGSRPPGGCGLEASGLATAGQGRRRRPKADLSSHTRIWMRWAAVEMANSITRDLFLVGRDGGCKRRWRQQCYAWKARHSVGMFIGGVSGGIIFLAFSA